MLKIEKGIDIPKQKFVNKATMRDVIKSMEVGDSIKIKPMQRPYISKIFVQENMEYVSRSISKKAVRMWRTK